MSFDTYKERSFSYNQEGSTYNFVGHNADQKDGWVIIDRFREAPLNLTNVGNEIHVTVTGLDMAQRVSEAFHAAGFGGPTL